MVRMRRTITADKTVVLQVVGSLSRRNPCEKRFETKRG